MDLSTQKSKRQWHRLLVFLSCYMVMVLHIGLFYSVGSLFVDIMNAFGSTRAETAVIQSTAAAVALGSGLLSGSVVAKVGYVKIYMVGTIISSLSLMASFFATSLTYLVICIGALNGLGFSSLYISSSVAISDHFQGRKKLLLLSLHASGAGLGGMFYPYLIRFLSNTYGFRGAFLIIGAMVMNTLPGGLLLRKKVSTNNPAINTALEDFKARFNVDISVEGDSVNIRRDSQQAADRSDFVYVSQYPVIPDKNSIKTIAVIAEEKRVLSSHNSTAKQTLPQKFQRIWQNKPYVLFICGMVISSPILTIAIIFMADIFIGNGLTEADVSFGFFLYSMMNTVGRLIPGFLLQTKRVTPLSLPVFTSTLAAIQICILTLIQSRWLLIILTGAVGIAVGMITAMLSIVTLKLVGTDLLPAAIGILFTSCAIGQGISGPVTGYIRDVTSSYTIPFYTTAAINLVAGVVFSIALVSRRKQKANIKRRSSVFYLTSM